jgi:hypothetical protein
MTLSWRGNLSDYIGRSEPSRYGHGRNGTSFSTRPVICTLTPPLVRSGMEFVATEYHPNSGYWIYLIDKKVNQEKKEEHNDYGRRSSAGTHVEFGLTTLWENSRCIQWSIA